MSEKSLAGPSVGNKTLLRLRKGPCLQLLLISSHKNHFANLIKVDQSLNDLRRLFKPRGERQINNDMTMFHAKYTLF